jgi:hypothetical protein
MALPFHIQLFPQEKYYLVDRSKELIQKQSWRQFELLLFIFLWTEE